MYCMGVLCFGVVAACRAVQRSRWVCQAQLMRDCGGVTTLFMGGREGRDGAGMEQPKEAQCSLWRTYQRKTTPATSLPPTRLWCLAVRFTQVKHSLFFIARQSCSSACLFGACLAMNRVRSRRPRRERFETLPASPARLLDPSHPAFSLSEGTLSLLN